MKRIDLNFLMKNLAAVFCVIFYIALLLPFAKIGLEGSGGYIVVNDYSTTFKGIQLLTDGSVFGIVLIVLPLIILVATYLPQLAQYKKFICLISSVATIFLVITCSFNLDTVEVDLGSRSIETHRMVGFWIMLVCSILLTFIYLVPFIDKNNNPFLSKLNPFSVDYSVENNNKNSGIAETDENKKLDTPQISIDKEKISGFAKNVAETISEQSKNIVNKAAEQVKTNNNAPVNKVKKGNPEEIMEQLKKLNELKESGILTDEEFTAKKQEMLERM